MIGKPAFNIKGGETARGHFSPRLYPKPPAAVSTEQQWRMAAEQRAGGDTAKRSKAHGGVRGIGGWARGAAAVWLRARHGERT